MTEEATNGGAKADRIRNKISASQARSRGDGSPAKPAAKSKRKANGRSRPANDDRTFFARALEDHPLAMLAGSVVLGAVAASLIPASVARRLGGRMLGFAALAGEMGAVYGGKALEKAAEGARASQDRLGDLGETMAEQGSDAGRRAIQLGAAAGRRALELAEAAALRSREASGDALKRIGDLSERVRP